MCNSGYDRIRDNEQPTFARGCCQAQCRADEGLTGTYCGPDRLCEVQDTPGFAHIDLLGNAERLATPRNLDVSLPENASQPERHITQ
jgi:hypothetical protein